MPITACGAADGCCPSGCTAANDPDCTPVCGDGAVEAGEACDRAITAGLPVDATGLAGELITAEHGIRNASATAAQLEAAGRLQQLVYRRLGTHPEWTDQIIAAMQSSVSITPHSPRRRSR